MSRLLNHRLVEYYSQLINCDKFQGRLESYFSDQFGYIRPHSSLFGKFIIGCFHATVVVFHDGLTGDYFASSYFSH